MCCQWESRTIEGGEKGYFKMKAIFCWREAKVKESERREERVELLKINIFGR